jgi:hypothetical protein
VRLTLRDAPCAPLRPSSRCPLPFLSLAPTTAPEQHSDLKVTKTTTPKTKPTDKTALGFGAIFTDHMLSVSIHAHTLVHVPRSAQFASVHPPCRVPASSPSLCRSTRFQSNDTNADTRRSSLMRLCTVCAVTGLSCRWRVNLARAHTQHVLARSFSSSSPCCSHPGQLERKGRMGSTSDRTVSKSVFVTRRVGVALRSGVLRGHESVPSE